MKRMLLNARLNAPDTFEVGDCENCPIVVKTYKEVVYNQGGYTYRCPLGYTKVSCPLEPVDYSKEQ